MAAVPHLPALFQGQEKKQNDSARREAVKGYFGYAASLQVLDFWTTLAPGEVKTCGWFEIKLAWSVWDA